MTCVFDSAAQIEERDREGAIAATLAAIHADQASGMAFDHCLDCGDEIDPARRQVVRNCRRCVACQEVKSAQDKWDYRTNRQAFRR